MFPRPPDISYTHFSRLPGRCSLLLPALHLLLLPLHSSPSSACFLDVGTPQAGPEPSFLLDNAVSLELACPKSTSLPSDQCAVRAGLGSVLALSMQPLSLHVYRVSWQEIEIDLKVQNWITKQHSQSKLSSTVVMEGYNFSLGKKKKSSDRRGTWVETALHYSFPTF